MTPIGISLRGGVASPSVGPTVLTASDFDGTVNQVYDSFGVANFIRPDSKVGLFAAIIEFTGADGTLQFIWRSGSGGERFAIEKTTSNKIRFSGRDVSFNSILDFETTAAYTVASGPLSILASWDQANDFAECYVIAGGSEASAVTRTVDPLTDLVIDYTQSHWGYMAHNDATNKADCKVANMLLSSQETVDITVLANRRDFFNADGTPTNWGTAAANVTSVAPDCYSLTGDMAGNNEGFVSDMTTEGTLNSTTITIGS